MMRWCENPTSDGGRRPPRNGRPGPLAGAVRPGAGPGRRPVRQGGASPAGQGVRARAAFRPAPQELLDHRRARRGRHPGWDAASLGPGSVGRRRRARRRARLAGRAPGRPSGGTGHRRDWGPQEGQPNRRGAASVHRHRRQGRQRPGRRLPGLRHRGRARGIDRELYLPQGWIDDPARCRAAGVPDQRRFATKPELARVMLKRALDAGVPAGWVTADEVYGNSPALRGWLEGRQLPYVLAVKATEPLSPPSGPSEPAARLARRIPPAGWLRLSAGQGAKGRRGYGWARLPLSTIGAPPGWQRWLLVRRSLRTGELAYYLCAGPAGLPLIDLVRVAGSRWRVEEAFQASKGLCGLDQHQVRRWCSWYRWVTLAMLAYAFLVVAAVTEHARHPPPLGLIALTCNEIQHLCAAQACRPASDRGHRLRWSWWRRRHQGRARACHYRRQANGPRSAPSTGWSTNQSQRGAPGGWP